MEEQGIDANRERQGTMGERNGKTAMEPNS